jgi:uncharacterized protein YlxP (DUF503 family)
LSVSDAFPQVLVLKDLKNKVNMTTSELPVHDYQQRFDRSRYNIKSLPNGEKSLQFLDHLSALSISIISFRKSK